MKLNVVELFAGVGGFRVGLNNIKEASFLQKKLHQSLRDGETRPK